MKKIISPSLKIFASIALASCSNPFGGSQSEVDRGHRPGIPGSADTRVISAGQGSEITASSQQGTTTSGNRFKVHASVSPLQDGILTPSSGARFKVFHGVQGEIFSQDASL